MRVKLNRRRPALPHLLGVLIEAGVTTVEHYRFIAPTAVDLLTQLLSTHKITPFEFCYLKEMMAGA